MKEKCVVHSDFEGIKFDKVYYRRQSDTLKKMKVVNIEDLREVDTDILGGVSNTRMLKRLRGSFEDYMQDAFAEVKDTDGYICYKAVVLENGSIRDLADRLGVKECTIENRISLFEEKAYKLLELFTLFCLKNSSDTRELRRCDIIRTSGSIENEKILLKIAREFKVFGLKYSEEFSSLTVGVKVNELEIHTDFREIGIELVNVYHTINKYGDRFISADVSSNFGGTVPAGMYLNLSLKEYMLKTLDDLKNSRGHKEFQEVKLKDKSLKNVSDESVPHVSSTTVGDRLKYYCKQVQRVLRFWEEVIVRRSKLGKGIRFDKGGGSIISLTLLSKLMGTEENAEIVLAVIKDLYDYKNFSYTSGFVYMKYDASLNCIEVNREKSMPVDPIRVGLWY